LGLFFGAGRPNSLYIKLGPALQSIRSSRPAIPEPAHQPVIIYRKAEIMHDIHDTASRLLDDYLEGDGDSVWRELHEEKTPMQTDLLIAAMRELTIDTKGFDAWLMARALLMPDHLGAD